MMKIKKMISYNKMQCWTRKRNNNTKYVKCVKKEETKKKNSVKSPVVERIRSKTKKKRDSLISFLKSLKNICHKKCKKLTKFIKNDLFFWIDLYRIKTSIH